MFSMGAHVQLLCLLLCSPLCSAASLRARGPSGQELGEQVGANIRAADEEVAAEASQNGGQVRPLDSSAEAFAPNEMVLVNPAVSQVIKQTNGLATSLVERDGLCERNWAANCPDGWVAAGGDLCVAPASYGGACKRVQSFLSKSGAEKQELAVECKAPWPCQDDCAQGRDYSELCPEGWSDDGGGFCTAPANFDTKCATSYDFAEMDTKTKQELAQTCSFNWKCKATCVEDYSKACPEDWSEVPMNPGICVAPVTYTGVCGFSIDASSMTSDQKAAFARKCAVNYACTGAGSSSPAQSAAHPEGLMPDGPVGPASLIAATGSLATVPQKVRGDIAKMFQPH